MRLTPGTLITTRAILFDMDGTLVDSTAAVERIWGRWARNNGVPFESFVHRMHGRRAIDTMREVAPPGVDPELAVQQIDEEELVETDGIVAIPGATELIAALPKNSWALVTSARPALARARMTAAGLPMPDIVVASTDIAQGKPHPECYACALDKMGLAVGQAIAFEDASAGVASASAAGCRTIALATNASWDHLPEQEWLPDLSYITLEDVQADGTLHLRVR